MYLKAEKYISGWDHNSAEERDVFEKMRQASSLPKELLAAGSPSGYIAFNVAYWRKVNQVHAWFVRNVQGDEDECKPYSVTREQLSDLVKDCETVLSDHSKAQSVLPTADGFFFGSSAYNEYYFAGLEETVKMVKPLLKLSTDWEFEYRSSW